jgi:DNA (cytosine-5)-methyltransferase 1
VTGRPKLLDLFCCQGGAAMGYHWAGFDVTGVDIDPQPRYPFGFVQADAMTFPINGFDAVHASPPCQDHTRSYLPRKHGTGWMLAATRERLIASGLPWVIENVPGAPMRADLKLCGCMFGLPRLKRERWFETSWHAFEWRNPCHHPEPVVTVAGHGIPSGSWYLGRTDGAEYSRLAREAMGIGWMTRDGLAQAIPPAYTEHVGRMLISAMEAAA